MPSVDAEGERSQPRAVSPTNSEQPPGYCCHWLSGEFLPLKEKLQLWCRAATARRKPSAVAQELQRLCKLWGTALGCSTWVSRVSSHLQQQPSRTHHSHQRGTGRGTCGAPRWKGTGPCQGNKGPCCVTASAPAPRAAPHGKVLHHGEWTQEGRVLPLGCPSALPTASPCGQAPCQGHRATEGLLGHWLGGPCGAAFHCCR